MKKHLLSVAFLGLLLAVAGCGSPVQNNKSGLDRAAFQDSVEGQATDLYTLTNKNGMEVCITNLGGRIVSIMVPDNQGTFRDVVLGFDNLSDYVNVPSDFGAAIGRYANRIAQGQFTLDGQLYDLPKNNFGHCLHGGPQGWQYKVFRMVSVTGNSLVLEVESPDGDQNFPGNIKATVTYTLTDDNAIAIQYSATTDRPTIINMTNHSYFNLSGDPNNKILDNLLWINADQFTPVDSTFMTTGEILPVAGTPMDFTKEKTVGAEIENFDFEQLKNGNGYDHNWVLNTQRNLQQAAARLTSPSTGITLEVYTDEPGIQVYTGNFLDGTVTGKKGIVYTQRAAICLETQHYPDSPNKPQWPSVVLNPGETYNSNCIFKFSTK